MLQTSGAQADDLAGVAVRALADSEDAEMIESTARRRAPQERRGVGRHAGAQRHPLTHGPVLHHGPVLDDVVVDGDAAWVPRRVPLDQQVGADLLDAHVVRRRRPRTLQQNDTQRYQLGGTRLSTVKLNNMIQHP